MLAAFRGRMVRLFIYFKIFYRFTVLAQLSSQPSNHLFISFTQAIRFHHPHQSPTLPITTKAMPALALSHNSILKTWDLESHSVYEDIAVEDQQVHTTSNDARFRAVSSRLHSTLTPVVAHTLALLHNSTSSHLPNLAQTSSHPCATPAWSTQGFRVIR
jgi:hypothetical protein